MSTLYLADAPTYASHIAAYPENGAAILALPAGTRRYIEEAQCEVVRSANGKYWISSRAPTGPRIVVAGAHWIGPHGVFTIGSSTGHTRKLARATYWQMPGFVPALLSRISLYQAAAGAVGTGTDAFQMRLYPANPAGDPIESAAPLFVWDWNATGSGGAGTLSLTNAGNNAKRIHADIPGGPVEVPPHFWLVFAHDLQGTSPNLSAIASTNVSTIWPAALNGTDVADVVSPNRSTGYEWTQAGFATAANACIVPLFKVVG